MASSKIGFTHSLLIIVAYLTLSCSPLFQLRAENALLLDEVERLKREVDRQRREVERENERVRRAEEARRKAEQELKSIRDSRGKILRGLNTQTEITLVQFKRDFDNLKKQLKAKDDIIAVQERKVASLVEANCTLRNGLQVLQNLPKHEDSESDDADEEVVRRVSNGLPESQSTPTLSSDLMQMISKLDSGRFDM